MFQRRQPRRIRGGQDITIKTQQATGNIKHLQEKVIYSYYFRTSKYNTFKEKLTALQKVNDWQWAIQTGVQEIGSTVSGAETFDKFEIEGTPTAAPLVSLISSITTPWHRQMDQLIYSNCAPVYPKLQISWRNDRPYLNNPPVEAIIIDQPDTRLMLTDEAINSGVFSANPGKAAYVYQLPYYMYYDYYHLQQDAANTGWDSPEVRYLLEHPFIPISPGEYKIYTGYRLPGEKRAKPAQNIYINKP